jgi:peptidoglycan/LPS O-acetylase OafA/YrhL
MDTPPTSVTGKGVATGSGEGAAGAAGEADDAGEAAGAGAGDPSAAGGGSSRRAPASGVELGGGSGACALAEAPVSKTSRALAPATIEPRRVPRASAVETRSAAAPMQSARAIIGVRRVVSSTAVGSTRSFFEIELLDNRYPSLHGLRVLGIVSVVQYHVTIFLSHTRGIAMDPAWVEAAKTVFFGMDLFFVLSGFLIGTILLRSVDSQGPQGAWRFYLRRIFRTFPLYYAVLTFLALLAPMNATQHHDLWMEYAYLSNYARPLVPDTLMMPWGWSLALEEQFYLGVPLLVFLLYKLRGDRMRLAALGVLWALPLALRLAAHLRHPQWSDTDLANALYCRTHTRLDALVAGIVIAYLQNRWREPIQDALRSPSVRAALALPSLLCLWILVNVKSFGDEALPLLRVLSWGTLTSIMYFCWLMLLLNGGNGWVRRALSLPVFRRMATLGYGVYLLHIPLWGFLGPAVCALGIRGGWPAWVVWPLGVGLLMAASLSGAYVMHVVVEKPFLRLRDRLAP